MVDFLPRECHDILEDLLYFFVFFYMWFDCTFLILRLGCVVSSFHAFLSVYAYSVMYWKCTPKCMEWFNSMNNDDAIIRRGCCFVYFGAFGLLTEPHAVTQGSVLFQMDINTIIFAYLVMHEITDWYRFVYNTVKLRPKSKANSCDQDSRYYLLYFYQLT